APTARSPVVIDKEIGGAPPSRPLRKGWSRTDPNINLTHVFFGEINRKGKPVGFHARPGGRDPADARVVRIKSGPNRVGVYTAEVEIRDPRSGEWKRKFSSFFPDGMNQKQVIDAILHAYSNRRKGRDTPWEGPSGEGFRIQGYLSRKGGINTAFPVYQRDR
ncbi:MAG TPA: hypothetical protein EYH03_06170, partial [Chromatiales bacterium]|nr:hypothetical protein [Chromatiales bacterium]